METKTKVELYIMSLGILFALFIIKTIHIPIAWGPNAHFVGFKYLLAHNISTLLCVLGCVISHVCWKRFLRSLNDNSGLPCKIIKIKNTNYEYATFLVTYIIPFL